MEEEQEMRAVISDDLWRTVLTDAELLAAGIDPSPPAEPAPTDRTRELLLAALEADRREAVGRERTLVRRGAGDKAIVYEQGIADGLRRALAIVETVLS